MKVAFVGSRNVCNAAVLEHAIAASKLEITAVVAPATRKIYGVPRLGREWAVAHEVPVEKIGLRYPGSWTGALLRALQEREEEILRKIDVLFVVWDGQHKETARIIHRAKELKVRVFIVYKDKKLCESRLA